MALGLAAAAAIPLLTKLPAALKGIYNSKHFLNLLIGGGFLGSTALSEMGKAGERGLTREQISLQSLLAKSQAGAAERGTKESRKRTEKYLEQLMKIRAGEKRDVRESEMLESFTRSQDRQMSLVVQALQGMTQRPTGAPRQPGGGGGMMDLTRGNY
ncbi:hypothetical protein LCGC14_1669970 [marine sediment metagenome]|uniref:Uncharacterized protein n=1 Tax=marine sediment metagenome TaxID=412755 RepID=A0A0F9IEB8_9ZZZZ